MKNANFWREDQTSIAFRAPSELKDILAGGKKKINRFSERICSVRGAGIN